MATVYIDPSATNDGDGTTYTQAAAPGGAGAFNTWASVTWTAGNTYLQRAGTTFAGSISVSVNTTGVNLGVYNASTGAQVTDGSSVAYFNGAGTTFTVRYREGAHNGSIIGIEVYGTDTSSQHWGFLIGNTASLVTNNVTIRWCKAYNITSDATGDCGGIKFFGSNITIEDCEFYAVPTDGIFGQGNFATIRRTRTAGVDRDGRGNGDNIQLTGNATLGCGGAIIDNNECDHSETGNKQCINVQDTTGGSAACTITNNTCVTATGASNQAIFVDVAGTIVRGNTTTGGKHGIFLNANNINATGNVISSAGIGIKQLSTATGGAVNHNTISDCTEHAIYADDDTTFSAKNNILLRNAVGLAKEGGATEDYNVYSGNTTDQQNLGGAASWGTHNVTADPQLRSDYMPLSSLVRAAGTPLGGFDYYNYPFHGATPSIGAVQYIAPRSTTTRTTTTRSTTARSTTTRRVTA